MNINTVCGLLATYYLRTIYLEHEWLIMCKKKDGQRAQIHCDEKGRVSIFSRHLEDMTGKYPDLVALVPEIRGGGVESFILEGEVVAVDAVTGALKTFQMLAGRARKGVGIGEVQVGVCVFAFDLMYLNGEVRFSSSTTSVRTGGGLVANKWHGGVAIIRTPIPGEKRVVEVEVFGGAEAIYMGKEYRYNVGRP